MADRRALARKQAPAQRRAPLRPGAESSFSPPAIEALKERRAEYVEEVSQEATRTAKRNRSDLVSAADVEAADQKLRQGRPGRASLLELLGGAIFGAGLSEFIAVMTTANPEHLPIALGCGGMVVGLVAIVSGRFSRD